MASSAGGNKHEEKRGLTPMLRSIGIAVQVLEIGVAVYRLSRG